MIELEKIYNFSSRFSPIEKQAYWRVLHLKNKFIELGIYVMYALHLAREVFGIVNKQLIVMLILYLFASLIELDLKRETKVNRENVKGGISL